MATTTRETRDTDVESDARPAAARRRPVRSNARAGSGAAGALALVTGTLARLIRLAAGVLAAIIVLGILLIVLEANPDNGIVSTVHDAASSLVGPFKNMFSLDDAKANVAVNWGIAALVYLIVGMLIARLIALIGIVPLRGRRTAVP
jgi:membrane-bound ClpP family serine protease